MEGRTLLSLAGSQIRKLGLEPRTLYNSYTFVPVHFSLPYGSCVQDAAHPCKCEHMSFLLCEHERAGRSCMFMLCQHVRVHYEYPQDGTTLFPILVACELVSIVYDPRLREFPSGKVARLDATTPKRCLGLTCELVLVNHPCVLLLCVHLTCELVLVNHLRSSVVTIP